MFDTRWFINSVHGMKKMKGKFAVSIFVLILFLMACGCITPDSSVKPVENQSSIIMDHGVTIPAISTTIPGTSQPPAPLSLSPLMGSGKYIVNTPYPSVPAYLPVYRIQDFEITTENATQIALSMGVRGNISNLYSDAIYIQDNSRDRTRRIEIYTNSGAVRYSIEDKIYVSGQSPPVLPSYDEAKKIADKYLEDRNLLGDDIRFREVRVGESQGEIRAGDSQLISYPVILNVIYERIINGTPMIGGSTIVYIGENGEVVGLAYRSRAIEEKPFRYVKIIRPEEAYRNLVDGKVLIRSMSDSPFVITNISLQYYLKDVAWSQNFVMPIYVFSGSEPSIYVSAVDPEELKDLTA